MNSRTLSLSLALTGMLFGSALGQKAKAVPAESFSKVLQSGKQPIVTIAQKKPAQAKPQAAKKPTAKKADAKKDGKKSDDKKKPAVPKTVQRPEKYEGTVDPKELDLKPDDDGKVQFSFNGQPWPDVLQWLADTSNLSLQWKELPGDYLTLTTRRAYTMDEARNKINQQLLSRGYTMLLDGELLYVVSLSKLNKAMIPRVRPEQLAERQSYEFVRCSFKLEWLVAGDAITELQPMLSEHGKLYQLASTNRIEAFDTVNNLRAIWELMQEEQSEQVEENLVRVFKIEHRRAEEVMRLVQLLNGINPDNPAQPMSSAQIKAINKAIAAAQKSGKGQVIRQPVPTRIVLNQPENSILVTAEPDQMKLIEQTIKQLDKPKEGGSLLANAGRMKIYRLNSYDPEPLVKLLEELGELDPQTQLKVDKDNRSIIAYASMADHLLIDQLIEKVDSATRQFSVIQLQELDAEQVAGTIKTMMGVEEEGNPYDYDYYYYRRRYGSDNEDKFKVEADLDKNRLLLRANTVELAEIKNLLKKLGEDPDKIVVRPINQNRMKVYQLPAKDTQEVLERLKKLWPLENKLEIDIQDEKKAKPAIPSETATALKTTSVTSSSKYQFTVAREAMEQGQDDPVSRFFNGTSNRDDGEDRVAPPSPPTVPQRERPPVRISVRNGQIVVTSNDPEALKAVTELLDQLLPGQALESEDYKIFNLQYIQPFRMLIRLEDFFDIDPFPDYFYGPPRPEKKSLGKKKEMRFISDTPSMTLIVQNATKDQLQTIASLIERFDVNDEEDRELRVTKIFRIQHSQASAIEAVIRGVYAELLPAEKQQQSSGDSDEREGRRGGRGGGGGGYTPPSFFGASSTYLTEAEDEKVKFNGMLSLKADPLSNTLMVSGTAALVKDISEKIEVLDQAAQPAGNLRVVQVSPNINVEQLQKRLSKLISPQPPPQQQKGKNQPNQGQPNQGQSNKR